MEIPEVLSLTYRDKIHEICRNLPAIGLDNFVMYIIFNNQQKFVLSNTHVMHPAYYVDGYYKEDFSYKADLIEKDGHYLCDQVQAVTPNFQDAMENRFNLHRAYYIIRSCSECTFVFGAIRRSRIEKCSDVYQSTIRDFENFCIDFVKHTREVIVGRNPEYRRSFIFNDDRLLRAVIKQERIAGPVMTERHLDCLWLAAQGMSVKEVARVLRLSPSTVETYNKQIREQLGCKTMAHCVAEAIKIGLIGGRSYSSAADNHMPGAVSNQSRFSKKSANKDNIYLLNCV